MGKIRTYAFRYRSLWLTLQRVILKAYNLIAYSEDILRIRYGYEVMPTHCQFQVRKHLHNPYCTCLTLVINSGLSLVSGLRTPFSELSLMMILHF